MSDVLLEEEDSSEINQSNVAISASLLCMVCEEAVKQYKCPRCDYFTCSLKCCKQHKAEVKTVYHSELHSPTHSHTHTNNTNSLTNLTDTMYRKERQSCLHIRQRFQGKESSIRLSLSRGCTAEEGFGSTYTVT